jgi:hypothetical protein
MEIKIFVSDCKLCKAGIKYFKSLYNQNKKIYAHFNMEDYTLIDGILLTPDYNCAGHLTHCHIARANKTALLNTIKSIEQSEKESRILKEVKKK